MDRKLRTIVITGASRGLGLELSKSLIEDGKH
jgi:NAD(P)-dependent dehydrogenase (short-subunit alcohol dehydrogenase family)